MLNLQQSGSVSLVTVLLLRIVKGWFVTEGEIIPRKGKIKAKGLLRISLILLGLGGAHRRPSGTLGPLGVTTVRSPRAFRAQVLWGGQTKGLVRRATSPVLCPKHEIGCQLDRKADQKQPDRAVEPEGQAVVQHPLQQVAGQRHGGEKE